MGKNFESGSWNVCRSLVSFSFWLFFSVCSYLSIYSQLGIVWDESSPITHLILPAIWKHYAVLLTFTRVAPIWRFQYFSANPRPAQRIKKDSTSAWKPLSDRSYKKKLPHLLVRSWPCLTTIPVSQSEP